MTGGYVMLKDDFARAILNSVVDGLSSVNYNGAYEYFKSLPNKQIHGSVNDLVTSQGVPISGNITANYGSTITDFGQMYTMSFIFSSKVYQATIFEANPNAVTITST